MGKTMSGGWISRQCFSSDRCLKREILGEIRTRHYLTKIRLVLTPNDQGVCSSLHWALTKQGPMHHPHKGIFRDPTTPLYIEAQLQTDTTGLNWSNFTNFQPEWLAKGLAGTMRTEGSTVSETPGRRVFTRIPLQITTFVCLGALIALYYLLFILISSQPPHNEPYHEIPFPNPYYPHTLKPGRNWCDCGKSLKEARSRNCTFDTLATAWLPPHCRDDDLTAAFDRAGPGPNGTWSYFADSLGEVQLQHSEIGALAEKNKTFWASKRWHVAHCLFYWQKYTRMRSTGVIMEERFDNLDHVQHCTGLIMEEDPTLDNYLIEVPVVMNSSIGATLESED